MGDVFDQLVFSWRLGVTKPDPEAFDRATEALGVAPDEVFFVDDSAANVEAARAAGWQAHHFTDCPQPPAPPSIRRHPRSEDSGPGQRRRGPGGPLRTSVRKRDRAVSIRRAAR